MTWVAEPVLNPSGRRLAADVPWDAGDVGGRDVACVGVCVGVDTGEEVTGGPECCALVGAAVIVPRPADPLPGLPEVQAARSAAQHPSRAAHVDRLTPPECHVTPIRIRGCVPGVSHRMIVTRFAAGMATHPAVALPSVTWRKNALPAPW